MNKTKGLGKGLGALLGDTEELLESNTSVHKDYIQNISISLIDTNRNQPRKTFNDQSIQELAASIKENGLIQPITIKQNGNRYIIIAGERRFRACKALGLATIPAIIKELSPRQVMEVALIENLQREDLNPIEEAQAIKALMDEYSLTQFEISEKLGKSRSVIANSLRLLNLAPFVIRALTEGTLTVGHAKVMAGIENLNKQAEIAQQCVNNQWSVRELERQIHLLEKPIVKKHKEAREIELDEAEESIRNYFGTKAKINGSSKKGKIEIEYFSRDDLERILKLISE